MRINFELSNACNLSCVHCIRNRAASAEYIPIHVVERVLDDIQRYGSLEMVSFGGGEPTLHPAFADIVGIVCRQGCPFAFVTNGRRFRDIFPALTPHLGLLAGISFSLDGANEATHDTLRGRPGSFREVLQSVVLARSRNINCHINTVVTKANHAELEGMASLASHLGCCVLDFAHCQPTPQAITAGLVLNAEERRRVEADVAALQRIYRLKIRLAGDHCGSPGFHQCPQLRMEEFNVDYRGRLTLCCMLSNYRAGAPDTDVIADLNEVSFFEAHQRLITTIAELHRGKVALLSGRASAKADAFTCTFCLLYFDKAPGIAEILDPSHDVNA